MACSRCGKNKQQWQVVAANGKVVFTSPSKAAADGVAKRYPESKVVQKGAENQPA